jgi:hypothetical protein
MKDYILIGEDRVILKIKKCLKCNTYRFKSQFEKNSDICNNYFCNNYGKNLSIDINDKSKYYNKKET